MNTSTLSAIIIDDHTLFRSGLHALLERRGIAVLGTAGDVTSGLDLIKTTSPDVALLDLRMPEGGGLALLKMLDDLDDRPTTVVLTTSEDNGDLFNAMRMGARGYLLKDMDPDELVISLRKAVAGESVIAPNLAVRLATVAIHGDAHANQTTDRKGQLTAREMEILCHIAEGESNKEIASQLGITDGTVKLHARSIMRKLAVNSRVEAAVLAVKENWCEDYSAEKSSR